jgi:hypothetical protein
MAFFELMKRKIVQFPISLVLITGTLVFAFGLFSIFVIGVLAGLFIDIYKSFSRREIRKEIKTFRVHKTIEKDI